MGTPKDTIDTTSTTQFGQEVFSTVFTTKTRSSDIFLSLVHVDVLYNRRLIFWLQLGQSVNQPWTGRLIDSNCKSIVAGSIFLHWTLPLLFAVSLYKTLNKYLH